VKDKDKRDESVQVQNSFWVYDIRRNTWSCIYKNDGTGLSDASAKIDQPYPRFAHQLVYGQNTKVSYSKEFYVILGRIPRIQDLFLNFPILYYKLEINYT